MTQKLGPFEYVEPTIIRNLPGFPVIAMTGSDKKSRVPVPGVCYLCHETKELLLSHIIPRWMYDWCKNETDRRSFSGSVKRLNTVVSITDGEKKYMLCQNCEQLLGQAENYLKAITVGDRNTLSKLGLSVVASDSIFSYLFDADLDKIKRALLGIAYKIHYCNIYPHTNSRIYKSILEDIRFAILNNNYSSLDIKIFAIKWMSGMDGVNARALNLSASMSQDTTGMKFQLDAAGVLWGMFVNKTDIPEEIIENCFKENYFPFAISDIRGNHAIYDRLDDTVDPAQTERFLNDKSISWYWAKESDTCPCGSGYAYSQCCQYTWALDAIKRFN